MNHDVLNLTAQWERRRAGSDAERSAARALAGHLRLFTPQVWQEPFATIRSPRPAWALLLAIAFLAGLLAWTVPGGALALSLLAALGFAAQAVGWLDLGWVGPLAESQNVVGVLPASGEVRERLVLVAHYDTGPRLFSGSGALWLTMAVLLLPLAVLGSALLPAPVGPGLTLLPLLGVGVGLVASLRPAAELDNQAGVAAALAAARAGSLAHTELWLLFTGGRVAGLGGMREFLARHGRLLADAHFVVLDGGDGGITLWQRRGEAALIAHQGFQVAALLRSDEGAHRVRAVALALDQAAAHQGGT